VRRIALGRVPPGRHSLAGLGRRVDESGVRFDGRLLIAAVDLDSGRRTMFGGPDAPRASVGRAVEASCAIPGWFRPVAIDGRSYVDGGAWSPTNMDVAPVERGARVLCLNPTASLRPSLGEPFAAVGPLSRAVAAVEARVLERRGAQVHTVSPDRASANAMGTNFMDPGAREGATRAGYAQGHALAARL
jgi:NTE family protein